MIQITHIRLSGSTVNHESIILYRWWNPSTSKSGESNKPAMVEWLDENKGQAYVGGGASKATVGVVRPESSPAYLRSYADGVWNNNLLALPRF